MSFTYVSDRSLFDRFITIETGSYREIIHFYEDYRENINRLEVRQRYEVYVSYLEALFEMGKYAEVLLYVDEAIETAIESDYSKLLGVDIYFNLLMKKAVALYQTGRYDDSFQITIQLLSMNPDEPNVKFFFKEALMHRYRKFVLPTRVFFIAGVITTMLIMAFEVLVIIPFYSEFIDIVSRIRNILFLFSILIFISGEASRYLMMEGQVFLQIKYLKNQKKSTNRQIISNKIENKQC
ncbi:MAG TPA: hypothetical protein PKY97_04625 [Saprospiraceae bacterium]|mgnify:CR=1 FL=1|jgi:tetratricopeptide (TPR) repeat protein|nr:hypothetical protein [Saprospiraceae bacterium]HRG43721.1 hypothetical protein [Saprospiraceae bacterium]